MQSRIIVALDVPGAPEAVALAQKLRDEVAMVKIGLEGFVGHGPDLVRQLRDQGCEIFLDLKLHDIPRTAAAAAKQAAALGVRLLTIHAAGGSEMVRAACDAVAGTSTQVIAVTVLTSLDQSLLNAMGLPGTPASLALSFGQTALNAGAHGLVCSPLELGSLQALGGLRVVPGIRLSASQDDQKRTATPAEAVASGATWIVVGRPIIEAHDPLSVVRAINAGVMQ